MPLDNRTEGYHWNSKRIRYSSPHCIDLQQFVKSEIWLDLFALWLMAWGFELKVAI